MQPTILGRDLLGVRDAILGLGNRLGILVQHGDQVLAPQLLQASGDGPVVILGPDLGISLWRQTGPLSSPAVRIMIETPVRSSPAMIARSTGAAPRQRGSNDGCTLSIR